MWVAATLPELSEWTLQKMMRSGLFNVWHSVKKTSFY